MEFKINKMFTREDTQELWIIFLIKIESLVFIMTLKI